MNHLRDILAIGNKRGLDKPPTFHDMTREQAAEVCKWIEHYSKDLAFKCDDRAYQILRAVFNSNILHRRGAYICGEPGIGKTYTFLALARYERAMYHPHPIMNLNVKTIEETYKIEGPDYFLDLVHYPRLAIHNFGFQSLLNNDYGTKRNLILELLDQRYDIYQQHEATRTYITTNKDGHYVTAFRKVVSRRVQAMMNYFEIK